MRTQATQTEPNGLHQHHHYHHQHHHHYYHHHNLHQYRTSMAHENTDQEDQRTSRKGLSTSLYAVSNQLPSQSSSSITFHQQHQQQRSKQQNNNYVARSVSHQFLSTSTVFGGCCPTGCCFDSSMDNVILNHHHYGGSSKSLRSSTSSHKVNRFQFDDDDEYTDDYSGNEDEDLTNDELSPQSPSSARHSHSYMIKKHKQNNLNINRHQFIIRTIPPYLNLSPRASYHRLNIKHPPNEICQHDGQKHDKIVTNFGDTILLCCSTTIEDSLWKDSFSTVESFTNNRTITDHQKQVLSKEHLKKMTIKNKPPIPAKPKHIIAKTDSLQRNLKGLKQKFVETAPTTITAALGTLEYAEQLSLEIIRSVENSSNFNQSCSKCGIMSYSSHSSLILPSPPPEPVQTIPPLNSMAMFKQQPGSIATIEWSMQPTLDGQKQQIIDQTTIQANNLSDGQLHWQTSTSAQIFDQPSKLIQTTTTTTTSMLDNYYSQCSTSSMRAVQYILEHKSFSESELYLQSRSTFNHSNQNLKQFFYSGLNRCHSAIPDLAVDSQIIDPSVFETIATPPPGFEDQEVHPASSISGNSPSISSVDNQSEDEEDNREQKSCHYSQHHHRQNKQNKNSFKTNNIHYNNNRPGGQLSIISPESEQSSQVTSVTNCSELLQTTGTTFSSEGTGSGSGYPYPTDQPQPGPSNECSTSSGMFHLPHVLASSNNSNGRLIMGEYALDFDDDDDDDDNDYDDDEVYEMETTESGHNLIGVSGGVNPDFAMAEGSSQEEKTKYEFEFETTEEDIGIDEYDTDNLVQRNKKELGDSLMLNLAHSIKLKRPNELNVGMPNYYHRNVLESPEQNISIYKAKMEVSTGPLSQLSPTSFGSGRVVHGTSKSLPENLYRSADDPEMLKQMLSGDANTIIGVDVSSGKEHIRLSRAQSSIFSRRRSSHSKYFVGNQIEQQQQHRQHFQRCETSDLTPVQDIYSSDPSTTIDLSIANTIIEKQEQHRNNEDEKVVGEGDGDIEEETTPENKLQDTTQESKTKQFSMEIFEKLNIAPETYSSHIENDPISCNDNLELWESFFIQDNKNLESSIVLDAHQHKIKSSKKSMVTKEDTLDENTITTATMSLSQREDIPLLLSSSNASCDNKNENHSHDCKPKLITPSIRNSILNRMMALSNSDNINENKNTDVTSSNTYCLQQFRSHSHHHGYNKHQEHQHHESSDDEPRKIKKLSQKIDKEKHEKPRRSIYDSTVLNNNSHSLVLSSQQHSDQEFFDSQKEQDDDDDDNDICKSESTRSSSIDTEEDSQTFSIENFPEDSTTSGSFMLDDITSANNSETLNGSYFISDSVSGLTSRNFYSVSRDVNGDGRLMDSFNRVGKSEPTTVLVDENDNNGHDGFNFQSLPSNINRVAVAKQIGGKNPNYLRIRFEQRQRKALERKQKRQNDADNLSQGKILIEDDLDDIINKDSKNTVEDNNDNKNKVNIRQNDDNNDKDMTCTDNFFGKYQMFLDSQYEKPTNRIISIDAQKNEMNSDDQKIMPQSMTKSSQINQQQITLLSNKQQQISNQSNNVVHQPTNNNNNNHNQQAALGQHPNQYCNTTDIFEQYSQATERDVECSEFSLQNQNSELDEDESLTFENLNNQSLSVIDEDSKGDQNSNSSRHEEEGNQNKHLMTGTNIIQTLSRFDSSGEPDKSSNIEFLEERDLSLEAVLREESKELERVHSGGHSYYCKANITLMEEMTTCHTSATFQQITTEDSSRDILDMSTSRGPGDEERTELLDERVALLTSATNDSSECSSERPMVMVVNNRQKFDSKLKDNDKKRESREQQQQCSSLPILKKPKSHQIQITDQEPLKKGQQEHETTQTFSLTYSHNNSTYPECSSMTTPDYNKISSRQSGGPEVPTSILKHSSSSHKRNLSQLPPFNAASSHQKPVNVVFANQSGAGIETVKVTSASGTSLNQHCCTRCYHRHHHHHHHHRHPSHRHAGHATSHKTIAKSSAYKGQPTTTGPYCLHQHNNHAHDPNDIFLVQKTNTSNQDDIILQARARSLTRNLGTTRTMITGGDDGHQHYELTNIQEQKFSHISQSPSGLLEQQQSRQRSPCSQHHFTCSNCGESTMPPNLAPIISTSQSRFKRSGMPQLSRKSFTVEDVYFDVDDEENDIGVHSESYRSSLWIHIGRKEELNIWNNLNRAILNRYSQDSSSTRGNGDARSRKHCRFLTTTVNTSSGDGDGSDHNNNNNSSTNTDTNSTTRSESEESTVSEKNFRQRYEAVTHRLIHRKASIVLYRKILDQTFTIDKCLTLTRDNNEFGFRIHGNRPVVVSAVEKGTSAQHKGLEVGDIIVAVNGHTVLDSSHSEVVRMAHYGHSLKLELSSTASELRAETAQASENEPKVIINGYLSRFIDKLAEKCSTSRDKMTNPKLWRRRWFVLKSDACLYWYRNPKSLEPIGAISLQGYCAGMVNECLFGQEHLFRLVGYKTSRCKYLAAIDHATAIQWVKALNQNSIQYSNSDAFIENTLHNIHRNPLNFINPDCYGFLWKYNQIKKNWKQRYFVLKDACLYFYADANSTTALGLFFLHGYRIQVNTMTLKKQQSTQPQQINERRHIFEIIPSDQKYRHIWLCADSESDRKRWTYALEYSIDRWIRLK